MRTAPFSRRRGIAIGLLVLPACTPHSAPNARVSVSDSASASASARPSALRSCPTSKAFARLPVFARKLGAPDDLLAMLDGSLWVSDPVHGTFTHLSASGSTLQTVKDPEAPEGIASLPDGRLAVAEQRLNRIVALRPPSMTRTTLFELPSARTAPGVDGIASDPSRGVLLVPDSPHGTLIEWPFSGGPARTVARDLGRGVGAAVGPDGAIYVASEAARGLLRIVNGRGEPVGAFAQADDIVSANGLLYVTLIDKGEVVAVDPASGTHRVLVTGIGAAQGLALLSGGRLAVADSNHGVIAIARGCSS